MNKPKRAGRPGRLWASRREAAFDVAVVVVLEALLVMLLWPLVQERGAAGLVLQSALVFALMFRRAAPLGVMLVMVVSTFVLAAIGPYVPELLASALDPQNSLVLMAVPFAAYSAVVYGTDRRQAWLMTGIVALIAARPLTPSLHLLLGAVVLVMLPALLGNYVAGLNERAERAEREQFQLAERARVEERVRLAAEMHDVVTHRVSLMVLQAGALGMTAPDAETRVAAEELRAGGCHALEELRDLVGVLRSAPGEAEELSVPRTGGQPPAPDLADLVAESEAIGVAVEFALRGDLADASPVVGRTAYRIVQEALTNARKHAPGAGVAVEVGVGLDRVRISVRNAAPERRVDAALAGSGSGTGLLGLSQRVGLVSGTLRAGATGDGGFEVDAVLPAYVPTRDEAGGPASARTEPADPDAGVRGNR